MAMVQCPGCGRQVSDESGICENCGSILNSKTDKKGAARLLGFWIQNSKIAYAVFFISGFAIQFLKIGSLIEYGIAGLMGILLAVCFCAILFGFTGEKKVIFISLSFMTAGYWISFLLALFFGAVT